MKYKFVYDTEFLEKNTLELTDEEVTVVLATIIGEHNAIFYGHKPERLVKAIKLLSHSVNFVEQKLFSDIDTGLDNSRSGIMYLKEFDVWNIIEQQFLYGHTVNDSARCTQFIATTSIRPINCIVPDVLANFDIVYKCKSEITNPLSKDTLSEKLKHCVIFKCGLISGKHTTSKNLEVKDYWMNTSAYHSICELEEKDPVYARRVALVARSLSDIFYKNMTDLQDIEKAKQLCEE